MHRLFWGDNMKKFAKIPELLIWCICCICFLFLPQASVKGVETGLQICATAILPSLFPFFVLTDYWIQSGYADTLSRFLAPVTEAVFHLPGAASSALLLGSVGGYPIGAKTAVGLYEHGYLTKEQTEQALLFCNNAGPAFVLGVLGNIVFQSTVFGILLYIVHLFSAYLIGLLFRPKKRPEQSKTICSAKEHPPISARITTSTVNAGKTVFMVCTYILFFAIITQCIRVSLPAGIASCILNGIFELAGGARLLSTLELSLGVKFILASFFLGTGGLCVMLQSQSFIQSSGLSGKKLFLGKSLQGILSACFAALISPLLPKPIPCFATGSAIQQAFILQTMGVASIILILGIFLKESSGKLEKDQI